MQSLLSSHRPHATRKPCLNSQNRVHGCKLVSMEGGDCSKRSNFLVWGCTLSNLLLKVRGVPFCGTAVERCLEMTQTHMTTNDRHVSLHVFGYLFESVWLIFSWGYKTTCFASKPVSWVGVAQSTLSLFSTSSCCR